jgi:hypothetical protein
VDSGGEADGIRVSEPVVVREQPEPGVAVLRLNRPAVLNALSNAVMTSLGDALDEFAGDGRTRAVIITGDARAFAAGADVAEFAAEGPNIEAWDRLWACPLPLVAAVRGLALGGGLELAMSCDLLVVAEDARLGQPEINLGIMPGAGGTQRLTRAVGKKRTGLPTAACPANVFCRPRSNWRGRWRAKLRRPSGRRSAPSRKPTSSHCTRHCSTNGAPSWRCWPAPTDAKASLHSSKSGGPYGASRS